MKQGECHAVRIYACHCENGTNVKVIYIMNSRGLNIWKNSKSLHTDVTILGSTLSNQEMWEDFTR